jgi:uncharacterized protein (TIGR00162 family)
MIKSKIRTTKTKDIKNNNSNSKSIKLVKSKVIVKKANINSVKSKASLNVKIISTKIINDWEIVEYSSPKIISPILIEGMPGIGNVGKIAMDILVEETKAVLIKSFYSKNLPNSVFVNEDNLVDLPKISLYYKRINSQDYFFLTGDVQPVTEYSSYTFSELIVEMFKSYNGKFMVTLGGIGLSNVPEHPKVYITGNDASFVLKTTSLFKLKNLPFESKIYGTVGPIIGISGLLLGISKKYSIPAYCLLAETLGHPVYVGLKGSRAILEILVKAYALNIDLVKLDKEIKQVNEPATMDKKDSDKSKYKKYSEVNYIG